MQQSYNDISPFYVMEKGKSAATSPISAMVNSAQPDTSSSTVTRLRFHYFCPGCNDTAVFLCLSLYFAGEIPISFLNKREK